MKIRKKGMKLIAVCAAVFMLCLPITALADIGLKLTSNFFVNDYANVISGTVEDEIVKLGQYLYDRTGAELVLVTVEWLDGYDIEDFAYNLFNEWELGSAQENNGVLIIFAPYEILSDGLVGDYAYQIGVGIEDVISAGDLQQLCNEYLEEYFLEEDYSGGALSIYEAVGSHLEYYLPVLQNSDVQENQNLGQDSWIGSQSQPAESMSNSGSVLTIIIWILVLAFFAGPIFILVFFMRGRRRRYASTYGVPFNPYSRRYVRHYGPGGYWGSYGRPMNPPPPPPRRSWFRRAPRSGWHDQGWHDQGWHDQGWYDQGWHGPGGPGAGGPAPRSGSMMDPGGAGNRPGAGAMGSRPIDGGGGVTRGTGGSRSGSGVPVSTPGSGRPTMGSGSTASGNRTFSGSRPTGGEGGATRGTGGSRLGSGATASTSGFGRSTTGSGSTASGNHSSSSTRVSSPSPGTPSIRSGMSKTPGGMSKPSGGMSKPSGRTSGGSGGSRGSSRPSGGGRK